MLRKVIQYILTILPYGIFLVLLGSQGRHGFWAAGATLYLGAFLTFEIESSKRLKDELTDSATFNMKIAWLLFFPTAAIGLVINHFLPPTYDPCVPLAAVCLSLLPNLPSRRLLTQSKALLDQSKDQLKQGKESLEQSEEKLKMAQTILNSGKATKEDSEIAAALISDAERAQLKSKQFLSNALGKLPDSSALEVRKAQIKAKEGLEIELNDSSPDELNGASL